MLTIDDISWCSRLDYKNSAWWFNLTQRFGLVGDNRIWASESDVAPFTVPTELHFSGRSPKSLHEVTPLFSNANRLKRGLVCCEQKKKRIKTVCLHLHFQYAFSLAFKARKGIRTSEAAAEFLPVKAAPYISFYLGFLDNYFCSCFSSINPTVDVWRPSQLWAPLPHVPPALCTFYHVNVSVKMHNTQLKHHNFPKPIRCTTVTSLWAMN